MGIRQQEQSFLPMSASHCTYCGLMHGGSAKCQGCGAQHGWAFTGAQMAQMVERLKRGVV